MSEIKKYCEGIDCDCCNEQEPCIYRIANELEEKVANLKEHLNMRYRNFDVVKEKLAKVKEIAEENKNTAQYQGICQSLLQIIEGD